MSATPRRRPRRLVPGRHPAPPRPAPAVESAWRAATRLFLRHYFDVRYVGRHHVPTSGPGLVVGNHPSYADPWIVGWGVSRWITWMAWQEAFSWPLAGWIVQSLGGFPVDTGRPRPSTLKTAFEVLAREGLLGVFFEGGRSAGFDLDPPRGGAARIAIQADVPIVPVSVAGVRRLWPRDGLPRPGKVVVRYHPPIHPAEFEGSTRARERALTDAVAAKIRSGLPPDGRHRTFGGGNGGG